MSSIMFLMIVFSYNLPPFSPQEEALGVYRLYNAISAISLHLK